MISIGNFFFRYRNIVFIFLYLALFIPSPPIFSPEALGEHYYLWPVGLGFLITIAGQLIRGATIGLAYIIRGGKDKKVYAEKLVTEGIFNHCRNPLYVGNVLMLLGVGILANSLLYISLFIPFFMFIYQAIVLAEENFLRKKFGSNFNQYCSRVNRWIPNLKGINASFQSMHFNWRRWLLKEYNTLFVWLCGITVILFFRYGFLFSQHSLPLNQQMAIVLTTWTVYYLIVRYLKKSQRLVP